MQTVCTSQHITARACLTISSSQRPTLCYVISGVYAVHLVARFTLMYGTPVPAGATCFYDAVLWNLSFSQYSHLNFLQWHCLECLGNVTAQVGGLFGSQQFGSQHGVKLPVGLSSELKTSTSFETASYVDSKPIYVQNVHSALVQHMALTHQQQSLLAAWKVIASLSSFRLN
jgi:hypothetical protein